ncbi:hypothetical protein CU661_26230 [Pseudomonas syringae pv. actinidifoliorum]|nr:hypothetical protein [Pseudomonas syringae pv. actinidifoliorum]
MLFRQDLYFVKINNSAVCVNLLCTTIAIFWICVSKWFQLGFIFVTFPEWRSSVRLPVNVELQCVKRST